MKQNPLLETSDALVIAAELGVRLEVDSDGTPRPRAFLAIESQIVNPTINLFGQSFDVVTIRFQHLRFTGDENGTDFDAKILSTPDGVEFGKAVEYITNLASLFPNYVPPWLEILFDPPGVAAKFGFPAFSVSIGNLAISNLAVNVRIEIPFDNRPIMGKLALSERDRPFLISFAPYGGGGYMALRTHATSIVGFELQLEFGAVVVIAYGPLHAFGMVSAGIYIEKSEGQDLLIAGFVRALGEGSIGCFSIAVHIEVRVEQRGSEVKGYAIFSFTFKVAFAKFRFKFKASHSFAGGKGSGGDANRAYAARLEAYGMSQRSLSAEDRTPIRMTSAEQINVVVDVKTRMDNWAVYSGYFD